MNIAAAIANHLKLAKAIIADPKRWEHASGHGSGMRDGERTRCAVVALFAVNPGHRDTVADSKIFLRNAARVLFPKRCEEIEARHNISLEAGLLVIYFNDHKDTTHADVMAVYDLAIAAAEQGGV